MSRSFPERITPPGTQPSASVEFRTGEPVRWPAAPMGWAQVVELRRTCVRLCYPCKAGRIRQPVVDAGELARLQTEPPLPLHNPLGRGVLPRSKRFKVSPPPPRKRR